MDDKGVREAGEIRLMIAALRRDAEESKYLERVANRIAALLADVAAANDYAQRCTDENTRLGAALETAERRCAELVALLAECRKHMDVGTSLSYSEWDKLDDRITALTGDDRHAG